MHPYCAPDSVKVRISSSRWPAARIGGNRFTEFHGALRIMKRKRGGAESAVMGRLFCDEALQDTAIIDLPTGALC